MSKIDFKKELPELFKASARQAALVRIPRINFLAIDGVGNPNTAPEFQQAIEALYGVAYTIKFWLKQNKGIDYGVPPLEGLWWTEDRSCFSPDNTAKWLWTLLIRQPDFVDEALVKPALDKLAAKRDLPAGGKLRLLSGEEGLAAQILHVGPYSAEQPTIERLHSFIKDQGYNLKGKHHEIYLGDPRRSVPEKLRTILRHMVE